MVAGVLSLTRNGLRDWIIQRTTAVLLGIYFVFLMIFLVTHPNLHYLQWVAFFQHPWTRIFNLLALFSLILHAWVGIWTVLTDYVKPLVLRMLLQVLLILGLIACFFWGIEILWGIY